jgi:hypothetical protein
MFPLLISVVWNAICNNINHLRLILCCSVSLLSCVFAFSFFPLFLLIFFIVLFSLLLMSLLLSSFRYFLIFSSPIFFITKLTYSFIFSLLYYSLILFISFISLRFLLCSCSSSLMNDTPDSSIWALIDCKTVHKYAHTIWKTWSWPVLKCYPFNYTRPVLIYFYTSSGKTIFKLFFRFV